MTRNENGFPAISSFNHIASAFRGKGGKTVTLRQHYLHQARLTSGAWGLSRVILVGGLIHVDKLHVLFLSIINTGRLLSLSPSTQCNIGLD